MTVRVFGVRHHGPGSARSLLAALDRYRPDIVLVEGPPDANDLLPWVGNEAVRPPVALLVYRPDLPRRAVFHPFAEFSPEWQAIRYALRRGVSVRFCDLPMSRLLADEPHAPGETEGVGEAVEPPVDPMMLFAQAAGYDDPETWFDAQIEGRLDAEDLFEALLEGFAAMRSGYEPDELEARREAWMRRTIAGAVRDGFQHIAVVCGAWHVPVLAEGKAAKGDATILKGLARVKTAATWVPWTNFRLAYANGYGAGLQSPGWYGHLWSRPERPVIEWVSRAALLLRAEGLDAPTSGVIDAVRAADALASLRGRRLAGLDEMRDAMRATICAGGETPLALIRRRLEVGEVMGEVPDEACNVPLLHDVQAQQRRLRLPAAEEERTTDLDLRKESDLLRSRLLHRLLLLGVPWGRPQRAAGRALGTFHELWTLRWEPDFVIVLVERSLWGNTVDAACAGYLRQQAAEESQLAALSALLRRCVLADLPDAIEVLLAAIERRASAADVMDMLAAITPLAEVVHYGDVRGTRAETVLPIVEGLWERIAVELPAACRSLDEDAAHEMLAALQSLDDAIRLLDHNAVREEWTGVLTEVALAAGSPVHALVRGWCCGVLLDAGRLAEEQLGTLTGLVLSSVTPADAAAAWVEGLLSGSGLLILQRDALWIALDRWLADLDGATFDALLPLMRRAVSHFTPAERRRMGDMVAGLHRQGGAAGGDEAAEGIDRERADLVLPVLAHILGVPHE